MFRMTTNMGHMTTPQSYSRAIAQELKAQIKARHVTQRELAEQSGVPLVTLNRKLAGHSSFNLAEVGAILEVLDMSLVELSLQAERKLLASA